MAHSEHHPCSPWNQLNYLGSEWAGPINAQRQLFGLHGAGCSFFFVVFFSTRRGLQLSRARTEFFYFLERNTLLHFPRAPVFFSFAFAFSFACSAAAWPPPPPPPPPCARFGWRVSRPWMLCARVHEREQRARAQARICACHRHRLRPFPPSLTRAHITPKHIYTHTDVLRLILLCFLMRFAGIHSRTGRLGFGKCGKGPTRNPSLVK